MVQPQRVRLGAQRVTGEQPAKQSRARHDFRQHLIAERVHLGDRRTSGHDAVIGEGGADATAGQLPGHECHIARRRTYNHADIGLVGPHMAQRVDTQQHVGQSSHLVGGQRPGADGQQEKERGGERNQPQPPQWDRTHAAGRVEHEIDGGGLGVTDHCCQPHRLCPPGCTRGLRPSLTNSSSSKLSAVSDVCWAPTSAKLA